MKKKTKKVLAVSATGLIVLSGVGGSIQYLHSNGGNNTEKVASAKKMTAEEKEAAVNQIVQMDKSGYRPTEIEKELRKSIDQLNKEQSTKVVREFMNSINSTSSYFAEMLNVMGPELDYAKLTDKIDNLVTDQDKISSHLVSGFMDEINRQHLSMQLRGDGYYIQPDANYVLRKYGSYVQGDYKDYLNLEAKQQTDPLFDDKKQMYDINRVKEDLEYIDNSRDRWSKGDYADDFKEMELNLYEIMFSVNHSTFFNMKVENQGKENETYTYTLKDDIKKKYEGIIQENPNSTLSKELDSFLKVLKDNKYQLNDKVDDYLKDMFNKKFGDLLNASTTQTDSTAATQQTEPTSQSETK